MGLRLRLTVVGNPHMTRTFLRCGTFDAKDLRHVMTKDDLAKIFGSGTSIDIDFFAEKGTVHLSPEGNGPVHFDSEVMLPGKKYPIKLNEKSIIRIGDLLLQANVFRSDFDLKHQQRQR